MILTGAAGAAELAARANHDRLTTFGETLRLLLRSKVLRLLAILLWAWLGWHFLAR
ncbi:DUF6186 family protein [Nocardia pseudobrasiliensis]|uniref:Uncharacterized protein n=1 Tax=Nocardia pseudobrasiliensis TaxID=45979 RepID=A0A370HTY6_9NOCA|nr:DUF6186 family protein [Nocardia pseudobrasiliensis]RDI60434.1 hypothetical protein DFR76_11564 [Nocardia pseudobrasiliensis]